NGCRRSRKASGQIASLSYDRFARDQRRVDRIESRGTVFMPAFTPVEQRDNNARIEEYRFQPPKPLRCFLSEPRSGMPEENLPKPAIRGRPDAGWDAASRRSASRTTLEGLQPRLCANRAKSRRPAASNLA